MWMKKWLHDARKKAKRITSMQPELSILSDKELEEKAKQLRKDAQEAIECGKDREKALSSFLTPAFALAIEASKRAVGLLQYEEQIMCGIALHEGKIAEMKTGEGKTLAAVLPAFLNALPGNGMVHIVTVNDYLAKRDAADMGKIFSMLGMTVGVVASGDSAAQKQEAYACDITYATNTELGFDYLRDNLAKSKSAVVMPQKRTYAIIDEADSILIDEARTPLIISGGNVDRSKLCIACNALAMQMERGESDREFSKSDAILGDLPEETGDYIVDEKQKSILLTETGIKKVEDRFGIEKYSDSKYMHIRQAVELALRANCLMKKDRDYIVRGGKVLIVDAFTGRIMEGRQYADGLHQAIEAKEGVQIQKDTSILATTAYQSFFGRYEKACGMTGTAMSEKREFWDIYGLQTVRIPTHKPIVRRDRMDRIFLTKKGKYVALLQEVKDARFKWQPVLVGTTSVQESEELSDLFTKNHIAHRVLNAKQDAKEAEIIAKAGERGAITIATNMAGRGTDIKIEQKAADSGGLLVIGTQRHEALRIDNQLRGRSGRQGDPGESVFLVSAEDDMIRLFGGGRIKKALSSGGYGEMDEVASWMFRRAVEHAQGQVEENHFSARKDLAAYDRINDRQMDMVYQERKKILFGEADVSRIMPYALSIYAESLADADKLPVFINGIIGDTSGYNKEWKGLKLWESLTGLFESEYKEHSKDAQETFLEAVRMILLDAIDKAWMEHLRNLELLRQGIRYAGYGQEDPKLLYAVRAYELYEQMKKKTCQYAAYAYLCYAGFVEGKESSK